MLRLSLEIPTVMLPRWSPLVDLDFVLAHKVLNDAAYASFFKYRAEDREVILDNSTHEFGKPMPREDLIRAANLCRANSVICPDIINPTITPSDHERNLRWVRQTAGDLQVNGYEVAVVLSSVCKDGFEDQYFLESLGNCDDYDVDMLCFTFHIPHRLDWWKLYEESIYKNSWRRVHILGMSSLDELRAWVKISEAHPEVNFSFDTSKPLKWGVQGRLLSRFAESDSMQGGHVKSKHVLDMKHFSPEQIKCCEENIVFLKAVCRGEA